MPDRNMDNQKELQRALSDVDSKRILNLISAEDININERDATYGLQTVLMRLCHVHLEPSERESIIGAMIQRGVDANVTDSTGRTALAHACIAEKCHVIETLAGLPDCRADITDNDGNTPLIYTVKSRKIQVVETLIRCFQDRGLMVNHKNNKGISALKEAESRFDSDICRLLMKEGGADRSHLDNIQYRSPLWTPRGVSPEVLPTSPRLSRGKKLRSRSTEQLSPLVVPHSRLSRSPDSCPGDMMPRHLNDIAQPEAASRWDAISLKKAHSFDSMSTTTDCESECSLPDVKEVEEEDLEAEGAMYGRGRRNSLSLPDLRDVPLSLTVSPRVSPRTISEAKFPSHVPRYERSLTLEERTSPLPQLSEEEEPPMSPPPSSKLNRRRGSISLPDLRDCSTCLIGRTNENHSDYDSDDAEGNQQPQSPARNRQNKENMSRLNRPKQTKNKIQFPSVRQGNDNRNLNTIGVNMAIMTQGEGSNSKNARTRAPKLSASLKSSATFSPRHGEGVSYSNS